MPATLALIGADSGGIHQILPAANELIWGAVSFLVLFWLLAKFAFPAMNKALQDRSDKIRGDLEGAEQDRAQAAEALREYRAQLAAAREEAAGIVEEAKRRAEQVAADLRARAEENANRIVESAQREIQGERERAVAEIRREVGALAVDLAGRVIGDSLDRDRQLQLVDRYIDEIGDGEAAAPSGGGGA